MLNKSDTKRQIWYDTQNSQIHWDRTVGFRAGGKGKWRVTV